MIFDKFYRGKDQRYLVRGTGMGLPIAKAIIAAHKGSVSVTSPIGSWLGVFVHAAGGPQPGPWPAGGAVSGETILVIDDEPQIRR